MQGSNPSSSAYVPKKKPSPWMINLALGGVLALIFFGLVLVFSSVTNPPGGEATPVPTGMPPMVVLPAGHYPPGAENAGAWNETEVPASMLPYATAYAVLPTPQTHAGTVVRIRIPSIAVDALVLQGDTPAQLQAGVGQHPGSADPGQAGNVVLAGYNDIYGEVFCRLEQLVPGDAILLTTAGGQTYTYAVIGAQVVAPTAVEAMAQTADASLTLVTAHPYGGDTMRLVVVAVLEP